jgi:hypothetical protein
MFLREIGLEKLNLWKAVSRAHNFRIGIFPAFYRIRKTWLTLKDTM